MDWSIGNIIGMGMRIISNRNEVARVAQKAIAKINEAEQLWGEVRALIEQITPELLVDLHAIDKPKELPKPHEYDVTWVQRSLNHLMHPDVTLKVDGVMGEHTMAAVRVYQRSKGLTADGWVGVLTLAALEDDVRAAHARAGR